MDTFLAKTDSGKTIFDLMKSDTMKKRFTEMTGKNLAAFTSAVTEIVNGNELLKRCEPNSILSAVVLATTLNLQINPSFGEAYIVPFKGKAVIQIGYQGYVQLALRSGQYKYLHAGVVHEGEIRGVNPLTGEFEIGDKFSDDIIGYVAHLELVNGFQKSLYMSKAEMEEHAKKYSQSYQRDKEKGWGSSLWSTNFDKMAVKTVLKKLLRNWGVKSAEIQEALQSDFKFRDDFNVAPNVENELLLFSNDEGGSEVNE